jgi:hypothetical protein
MQPAGAGIVDSVDNLKTYSPQYPQNILLIAEGAGASAAFVGHMDHLDHAFLIATPLRLSVCHTPNVELSKYIILNLSTLSTLRFYKASPPILITHK